MVEPSGEASGLMANERDMEGRTVCPVCREVIPVPDLSPFIGDERVHVQCWSSPFRQSVSPARDATLP